MLWYKKNKIIAALTQALSSVRPSLAPDLLVVALKESSY